jgi:hypothetical protein
MDYVTLSQKMKFGPVRLCHLGVRWSIRDDALKTVHETVLPSSLLSSKWSQCMQQNHPGPFP